MVRLYCEVSGSGGTLLVLLHGLGATGAVWSPFITARPGWFSGRIAVVDLPGHGASESLGDYAMSSVAECIADTLRREVGGVHGCVLLGHSYGGVAALELANFRWELEPGHAFGLGIKTLWNADELTLMRSVAAKPPRQFETERAAYEWYRKTTGLAGLTGDPEEYTRRGVHLSRNGQWSLALDPRVNAVDDPGMARLIDNASCPVSLGYGETDTMIIADDMKRHDAGTQALEGGGHNIMVTHPEAVWAWIHQQLQQ